ncbi:MAG: protein-L-isoaspartate O-methyltransferase [Pseudomonadota bacterium]
MNDNQQSFAVRREMMVDTQVRPSDVTKFPIIDAMLTIPRERFVPDSLREAAYLGDHLPLGDGRVLLDARTFGKMLDALDIQDSDLVLDLGCGLGYSSAVLGRMAEAVVAIEDEADWVSDAQSMLSEVGIDNVAVIEGALAMGASQHGPFDAIILQGAVDEIPPQLIDQLKEDGRIIAIFRVGNAGAARLGTKSGGRVSWRWEFDATAPLLNGFEKTQAFTF